MAAVKADQAAAEAEVNRLGSDIAALEGMARARAGEPVEAYAKERIEEILAEEILRTGPGNRFRIPEMQPRAGGRVGSVTLTSEAATSPDLLGVHAEYPNDVLIMEENRLVPPSGSGSRLRFRGRVKLNGSTVESAQNENLSFILLEEAGLVYLTGRGTVTLGDGRVVHLP